MNTNRIAKILSYIFIPPVMNIAIFILLAFKLEEEGKQQYVILSAIIFGFLLPLATFIILRKKGKIVDDDATIKEERTVPYLFGISFSILAIIFLYYFEISELSVLLWISYFFNSIVLIAVNKYWKISAHAMGAAIPFSASTLFGGLYSLVFGIVLLLVSWARYKLKVHTVAQIIAGAFVGFIITFLLLNLGRSS